MLRAPERAECGFDLIPPLLVLEGLPNRCCDEGASLPAANPCIESVDQLILQTYVHTHGHNLAHRLANGPES